MTPEYTLQAACVKLFKLLKPHEEGRLFLNLNNPRSRTNGHFLKGIGLTAGVADMTYLSTKGLSSWSLKPIRASSPCPKSGGRDWSKRQGTGTRSSEALRIFKT
jgi:hypothetical protein